LADAGVEIKAYDPVAMEEGKRILGNSIVFCEDKYEALIDAEGLVVVTEWPEFRVLNYNVLNKLMLEKVILTEGTSMIPKSFWNADLLTTALEGNPLNPQKDETNPSHRRSRIYRITFMRKTLAGGQ
jgi:hypothetical protein